MPRRPLDSPPQRRKATRPTVQLPQSPGAQQVLSANLPSTTTAAAPAHPRQAPAALQPPPPAQQGPSPAEQVGWWLAAVNMQGFFPAFVAHGFDSLEACAELTAADLPALGIHLMGHTRVMLSQIAQLKQRVASMAALSGGGGRGARGGRGGARGRGSGGAARGAAGPLSNMAAALQTVSTVLGSDGPRSEDVDSAARPTVRLVAPALGLPESPQRPGLLQRAVDSSGAPAAVPASIPLSALRDPFGGADREEHAFNVAPAAARGQRTEAGLPRVGLDALRGDDQAASYRSPASGLPAAESLTQLSNPFEASGLSATGDGSPRSALLRRIETACRRYEAAMAAAVAVEGGSGTPASAGSVGTESHVRVIIDFCDAHTARPDSGPLAHESVVLSAAGGQLPSTEAPPAAAVAVSAASPMHSQHRQREQGEPPRSQSCRGGSSSSEQTISYALEDDGAAEPPRRQLLVAAPTTVTTGEPPALSQRESTAGTLTPRGDTSDGGFTGDAGGPADLTAEAIAETTHHDDSDSSVVEIEPRESTTSRLTAAAASPLSRQEPENSSQTPLRRPPPGAVQTDVSPAPLQQYPAPEAQAEAMPPSRRESPQDDRRGRSTTTRRRSTCHSAYTNDVVADPDAYVTFSRLHPAASSVHRKSEQRQPPLGRLFRTPSERRGIDAAAPDDDDDDADRDRDDDAAAVDYDAGFGDGYEDYLLMQYSPPAEDDGGVPGSRARKSGGGGGEGNPLPPNLGFTQDEPFVIDDDDDDDDDDVSSLASFGSQQGGAAEDDDASDASSSVLVASHQSARPQPRPAGEPGASAPAQAARRLQRLPTRLKMRRMSAAKLRKAAQAAGLLPCAAPDAIPSDQRGTASPPIGTGASTTAGQRSDHEEHDDPRERRRLQFLLATALARRQFQTAVLPALNRVVADGGDGRLQVDQSGTGVAPGADRRQVVQRRKEEAERGLARSIVAALVLHSIEERVERVASGEPLAGGGGGPSDLGTVERSLLREDVVVEDVLAIAQRSLPSLVRAPIERLLKSSAVSARLGQPDRFNAEPGSPADGATPRTTQRQAPAASRWWRGGRGRGRGGRGGVGIN